MPKEGKHREFVENSGEKDAAGQLEFFGEWCAAAGMHLARGALVELFIDWRSQYLLQSAAQAVFGALLNFCVWVKNRAGMGGFLRSRHEIILIYRAPGGPHQNNIRLGKIWPGSVERLGISSRGLEPQGPGRRYP